MGIKITGTNTPGEIIQQGFKRNAEKSDVSFGQKMEAVNETKSREALAELTKNIFDQGELVAQKCDITEFKRYKELITEFFNEVVSSGYQYAKEQRMGGRAKGKIYANIKQVNTDMDKLAAELMKTQQNQVAILNMVDDIRGIIIDIMA
jgi:uncharacterized protein YaaR (DUF327 family)